MVSKRQVREQLLTILGKCIFLYQAFIVRR